MTTEIDIKTFGPKSNEQILSRLIFGLLITSTSLILNGSFKDAKIFYERIKNHRRLSSFVLRDKKLLIVFLSYPSLRLISKMLIKNYHLIDEVVDI